MLSSPSIGLYCDHLSRNSYADAIISKDGITAMRLHEEPKRWLPRSPRRRPIAILLLVCSLMGLSILFIDNSRLARQAHHSIHSIGRRGLDGQQFLATETDEKTTGIDEDVREHSPAELESETRILADDVELPPVRSQLQSTTDPNWIHPPDTEAFPSYEKYTALVDQAYGLPDLVYIPLEEAVKDDVLHGWEAEWLVNVTYDPQRWGLFQEPRIDFVYTCKLFPPLKFRARKLTLCRGQWI